MRPQLRVCQRFRVNGTLYFFNEAATGLIGLFPAVGKVLPLSAFWVRCPMLGGGQQLVVLRKTSLWLLLAWFSSGQQAESGADNRL